MRTHDTKKSAAGAAASRHLFEAIELVRADMAKVEFWANAVEQFAQPAPEYDPDEATLWLPSEAGTVIKRRDDR
jgi:hypothetical protein